MNYNEINNLTPVNNSQPSNKHYLLTALIVIVLVIFAIFVYDSMTSSTQMDNAQVPPVQNQLESGASTSTGSADTATVDAEIDAVLQTDLSSDYSSIDKEF
jgi:biopolymer transport protein ExbD